MFEFFGVRVVSSALRMQILLCTELLQCKGCRERFPQGFPDTGVNPCFDR